MHHRVMGTATRNLPRPDTAEARLELVEPDVRYREAYLAMLEEYRAAGEDRYQDQRVQAERDFGGLVRTRQDAASERDLPEGRVPASEYWLVRNGREIVGVVRLRHRLTESNAHEGGHIGYDVIPSARGRGYATLMLRLVLEKARQLGLARVLVTCQKDNLASARVIRKNGGQLQNEVVSPRTGKPVQRYWVTTAP